MTHFKNKRKIAALLIACVMMTSSFANLTPVLAEDAVAIETAAQVSETAVEISANTIDKKEEKKFEIDKVTEVSVVPKTYRSLQISFSEVSDAAGYEIYRKNSEGQMDKIANLPAEQTSFVDMADGKYLTMNKKYVYQVRAYGYDAGNQLVYGVFSDEISGKPTLNAPEITTVQSTSYQSIKLTYKKVNGAKGYVIYRSTKKTSGFKKIATIKKGKTVEYTDKKCKTGTKYYYKVRAYRKVNGKTKYGNDSPVVSAKATLKTPKLKSVVTASGDTALLTWKKVAGASGYRIYRSDTKNGRYKKIAQVPNGTAVQAYVDGQENGKTFYYKVRAYRTVDKKKKYSDYSKAKSATFNLLASANETYAQKSQRIFGLDYYKKYATKEEAELHMVTVTVPVWDFAPNSTTKVTKQKSITVHKNIAETVKQIFKEIYEGEEQFPIKNVGGYSWRGEMSTSEHCCGLAIDINWEENYLIDNGIIISGKLYQPGINPYSIPTDGEVAKIMNKYGFSQGLWGNRCDYMHFSYFGT